jgi:hypothetical protein
MIKQSLILSPEDRDLRLKFSDRHLDSFRGNQSGNMLRAIPVPGFECENNRSPGRRSGALV